MQTRRLPRHSKKPDFVVVAFRHSVFVRRSALVCAGVGLLAACSGVPRSDWYKKDPDAAVPSPSEQSDPGAETEPSHDETRDDVTDGEATTSAPPTTPPNATEESGYTPIRNDDGSIARPMWLDGTIESTRFSRLTNEQWERSVRDLLRLSELPTGESRFFEQVGAGATDFVNDQSRLQMTNTQWAQYQAAAESLVGRVAASDTAMQNVYAGNSPEAFVREFGLRAFRRPLSDGEVSRYLGIFETGTQLSGSQSDFTRGAGLVVEVMLQSPHFLYRIEAGAVGKPLTGYEKAAKLSLYLLRTTPSDALLAKAAAGDLDTPEGVRAEAAAMLETDDAAATFQAFHSELYELGRFVGITKSDPAFTEAVGVELIAASEAFFDRIFRKNYGLVEILTTRRGFVGPATAEFYGVEPAPSSLTEVSLPEERAGFFTQLPYLAYFARDTQSYGILRGVHLNTEVLCAKLPELSIPAPPLPEVEYTTSREYMEKGTVCGGACHTQYINPLGFSMENFDGLGRTRTLDNGAPVDTTGAYPFVGGMTSFDDAVELMNLIAENAMAHECYSRYVASHGLGRTLGETDRELVDQLANSSLTERASTKELVLALVSSAAFNTREGASK